jgi:protein-tyrosine phosphatase
VITINGSKYLLVEFPFDEDLRYVESILQSNLNEGLQPIVAHAERYECIQKNLFILEKWKKSGVLIQVNKGSLIGRFGRLSYNAAHSMMQKRQVDVIASDCHSTFHRTPVMMDVYENLQKNYPREYREILFNENPQRICSNQKVLRIDGSRM